MNKVFIYVSLVLILVMGFASAFDNIGTYRTNTPINLNLGCSYNNTYCPNTFSCNITIYNKNGILVNNKEMGTALFPQYNYTLNSQQINITGLYYGRQVCCGSIGCNDYSFEFNVNAQGKEYGSIEGIIYFILLTILLGVFAFSLYGSFKIEFKNNRSVEGNIISINWGKYLKMFLFSIAYVCFIGITYFAWNISYGILEFKELSDFFFYLYNISYIMILPILIVGFVFILILFVSDKNTSKMIERGLTIK